MTPDDITIFLNSFDARRERTMVVVDFGNVEKWKNSLSWRIGIREMGTLAKHFAGKKFLRRFYYGADYGRDENSTVLSGWSHYVLQTANWNGFNVNDKRVKYIHSPDNVYGFEKKCDLDVEMAVDLIRERDAYDTIVLFSGDGDLMYAVGYLHEQYGKRCVVMSARGHIGREVLDAKTDGTVEETLFAEDFEYRLSMDRFPRR